MHPRIFLLVFLTIIFGVAEAKGDYMCKRNLGIDVSFYTEGDYGAIFLLRWPVATYIQRKHTTFLPLKKTRGILRSLARRIKRCIS